MISEKLGELEHRLSTHDIAIRSLFLTIKKLMQPDEPTPEPKKRPVGFRVRKPDGKE